MLRQYLVGAAASVCNIAIHALVMAAVIRVTRFADDLATGYPSFRLIAIMIATVIVLMIAHLAEVLVWSLIYAAVGAAPPSTDLVHFELHHARLRRCDAGRALASARTDDCDEWCAAVWLSTAVIFEVLRMTLLESGDGVGAGKRERRWGPE